MNTSHTITCDGFSPSGEDLTYSFYYKINDNERYFLVDTISADAPTVEDVLLPAGEDLVIEVDICNPYGACVYSKIEGTISPVIGIVGKEIVK